WINKGEIMPEGYEGASMKDSRLGEQDQARRRGGASEGLSASRESGRGRQADREGLGPVGPAVVVAVGVAPVVARRAATASSSRGRTRARRGPRRARRGRRRVSSR